MSHYSERLAADEERIRHWVAKVGQKVEVAQSNAVRALLTEDRALAYETVLGDLPINREVRAVDRACHAFVALHLPSAGHLRFISSVMRLMIELERIGDYAVTIAREAVQLEKPPPALVARDIELLSDQSRRVLAQAIEAWNAGSADLARGTLGMVSQARGTFDKVIRDLVREGQAVDHSLSDLLACQVVLNRLGRVSDQAKNICEETIFAVTGESKEPKTYRVLFVDERNDGLSQLAAAYARKAYVDTGRFSSAGWAPAEALNPHYQHFMEDRGLDAEECVPSPLQGLLKGLAEYHVVVSLGGDLRPHTGAIPFRTVVLEWDLAPDLEGLDAERTRELLAQTQKDLGARIRNLMELLRGEEAS